MAWLRLKQTCPRLSRLPIPRLSPPSQASWRRHVHQTHALSTTLNAVDLAFGQPVHETHPHILKPGEITIGITANEYHERRCVLASNMPVGAVAFVAAAPLMYRTGPVFHPYRQDSNMLYLTGFNEASSVAAIQKTGPNPSDYSFHLYVLPKDPLAEQWAGPRSGVQAAIDVFNADEADTIANADSRIAELVRSATAVYADVDPPAPGKPTGALYRLFEEQGRLVQAQTVRSLSPLVHAQRAIKSPAEIANMRRAGQLSGRVITDAMRRPWTRERDLHTFLDYTFISSGLDGPAYIPVVSSGRNANVIHYVHNNNVVRPDDMILIDAGGEYGTYITDISRAWPASGKFTPPQRDLYQAVLDVQRAGVALCRANANLSLHNIHQHTLHHLITRLREIGFDVTESNITSLFPHHVGHYIGLDVHDTSEYSRNELLRPGHCVTIEPGVYVPDDERWPKHFRGIGIRIEDSICVEQEHPFVLTTEAVKEVADIEALRE